MRVFLFSATLLAYLSGDCISCHPSRPDHERFHAVGERHSEAQRRGVGQRDGADPQSHGGGLAVEALAAVGRDDQELDLGEGRVDVLYAENDVVADAADDAERDPALAAGGGACSGGAAAGGADGLCVAHSGF